MHPIVSLLQLLRLLKRVEGRKKLQKIVHILQTLGAPFPQRFEYSYYGMYSSQLRGEIERLESERLVTEKENLAARGHSTYLLTATKRLEKLLDNLDCPKNPPWADLAQELNDLSAQQLEAISTILFLEDCGLEGDALRQRFQALKPHLESIFDPCLKKAREFRSKRLVSAKLVSAN
ncbi:hypothetical protein NXS98_13105 [Fontisphaera persica]|uniref:hypothetical protein n=1 Tax=Fontisphaera persica TaxID=2974023 RepID=UPI0024BFF2B3|nr:hypothetical protein [Fontisphaera persica]WCJ58649.1 hypothetical protein NXS98_13105 [Fontisphaera persica]